MSLDNMLSGSFMEHFELQVHVRLLKEYMYIESCLLHTLEQI